MRDNITVVGLQELANWQITGSPTLDFGDVLVQTLAGNPFVFFSCFELSPCRGRSRSNIPHCISKVPSRLFFVVLRLSFLCRAGFVARGLVPISPTVNLSVRLEISDAILIRADIPFR